MSIMHCVRHQIAYDTDLKERCPLCDNEPAIDLNLNQDQATAVVEVIDYILELPQHTQADKEFHLLLTEIRGRLVAWLARVA